MAPDTAAARWQVTSWPMAVESMRVTSRSRANGHRTAGRPDQRHAVVELAAGPDDTSRNDQVLAFAQIVFTLTAHRLITGVSFTSNGQAVAVPVADGSLSTGPLTATDYTALLTDG